MSRTEVLIESQPALLELTSDQARALLTAGRRLASDKEWWGATEAATERSVIRCQRETGNLWSVRVSDAVGLIAVDDLRIEVRPKIPVSHLLYLFAASGAFPRLDDQELAAASGWALWELVARWFLGETERLLRKDLIRDYLGTNGWLPAIRGRVDAAQTTRALVMGRLEAHCEYEDFAENIPLNRTLREAARLIAASPLLGWTERRRALAIQARMTSVGVFQRSDLRAKPDRRSAYYRKSLSLAHAIIRGQGRALEAGQQPAWTFLIRTPEMVEAGVREILRQGLRNMSDVTKLGLRLPGSTLTFNPDLVFGRGQAIADIKYKLMTSDWNRQDLYQVIAFAVAFGTSRSALIGFRSYESNETSVVVETVKVSRISWLADSVTPPSIAARKIVNEVERWLENSPNSRGSLQ